jgi:hypothetical protein
VYGEHAISDSVVRRWVRHFNEDMGIAHNPWIKAAVHGMEAHIITNKEKIQTISTCKIMCTVFWYSKGVLLVEFLPHGSTFNTGVYCSTLKKLHPAIQKKNDVACLVGVLWCFMTMLTRTLPPQHKISLRHLAGNNSIIPPSPPSAQT